MRLKGTDARRVFAELKFIYDKYAPLRTFWKLPCTNRRMTLVFPHLALPTTSSLHVDRGTPLRTAAALRESREAEPSEEFCQKVLEGGR